MSTERTTRETLAGRLLAEHEKHYAQAPTTPHPEDETLSLFAEGRLSEPQLGKLIQHLADCGECRSTAGMLLIAAGEDADIAEPPRRVIPWYRRPALQVFALAAGLLLCVTGIWLFQRPQEATVALAGAGKLTEFGVGIGGVVARDPSISPVDAKATQEQLDRAPQDDPVVQFNKGHLLLQLNEPEKALAHFQEMVSKHPNSALALLGLGSAQYLLKDYTAAAESFQQSLELEPDNHAARMNLAMTYEELGDAAKALASWRQILADPSAKLDVDERSQIEAQVRTLEQPK